MTTSGRVLIAIGLIAGLVRPDSGTIRIGNGDAERPGLAVQELSFYRDLTPRENLRFFARMHGLDRRQSEARAQELLELFEFDRYGNALASSLSGGWQRRLHVAIALVQRASIVMLDEPTAGLDVESVAIHIVRLAVGESVGRSSGTLGSTKQLRVQEEP